MALISRGLLLLALACACIRAPCAAGQPAEPPRPVLIRTPPQYPELARRMHICGEVLVRAQVRPDGLVSEANAISGHALLRQAAEDAVRRWRFTPEHDATATTVSVNFLPAQ
jgi:TonB family protein